ncbi:MAG: Cation transporter/ATPase, N-terminus, partial [Cyanobacteriota bacterium]
MTIKPIEKDFIGFTEQFTRLTTPWYQKEVADILAELNSTSLGLSQAAVEENLAKYGKNILNEAQPRSG